MDMRVTRAVSANTLRREISARNIERSSSFHHETTFGNLPSVLYREEDDGGHGNFLPASYRRIRANPAYSKRLEKAYTSSSRVPRQWDRRRGELECGGSSDALLMNIFCYPRLLCRPAVRALLGTDPIVRPEFGIRARIPMHRGELDRTELDMVLGHLIVEAKLTEANFGSASRERLMRYQDVERVFEVDELPWSGDVVSGYQLIRGVLAAEASGSTFMLLCDRRRADLLEIWFQVLRAVSSCEVRSRMALLHWQELAAASPARVRMFLQEKYGIEAGK